MSKFDFSCCRIIITLSLYLSIICVDVYSQSSDHNCILNRIFTDSSGSTYQDKIDYYDGLGRLEQSIIGYSHWDTDLITFQEYDSFGRISNQWLPASIQNNGGDYLSPAVIKNRFDALYSDAFPYSKNIYENSPLNRVLEQYGAGQDWHNNNKSVVTTYNTNMSNSDVLNCKLYQVGGSRQKPLLNQNGNYTNGELYVTEVRDENGTMFYEFKDKQDQLVLTRNIIDHTMYDTYYIYDDYSNLCFVLPPRVDDEGYSQANLDKFTFQYRYDERNRCIAKKMPGSDWVYYIYDESDRPIFSQDGEQRRKEQWMFNVFDSSNRVVLTGLCKNIFDYLADPLKTVAVKVTWTGDINVTKGYAITGITLVNPVVLSVNYYNNYSFLGKNGIPVETDSSVSYDTAAESEGFGQRYTASAQGLLTGMLTARLDDSAIPSYDYSVLYYDSYGHLIQTKSNNHLPGGIEKEYVAYNFVGQPIRRKHVHSASGKSTQTEVYSYTYDHAGRLLTTTHQLNDGSPVVLVSNEYDELGRLKSNNRNGLSNLKTDYTYNVRSWVKSITCPLFNVSLYYNDRRPNGTNVSCYNGNISGIDWKAAGDKARGYNFSYDNLSRLTGASYLEGNAPSDKFSTSYSYDKHGNMQSLSRHGNIGTSAYGIVDDLTLSYNGNQLVSVEDKGTNPSLSMSMDFKGGSHESVEYAYDGNGNMVKDLNKGIGMIEYNSLNLPRRVTFTGLNNPVNEYVYSAGGKKLTVIHRSSTEKRTDYVGNMIYENGSLKRILVDGGYIENGTYHFYLQDHLGNNRVVAKSDGTVVQTTHYYPYGMSFAEGTFADKQPYKYNGKELDTENGLNLYDYDARQMDATLGRFTSVDPMAEYYYCWSPYAYCMNNPINVVDPTGTFSTRFGAWLYKLFNGGDQILKDTGGEYFVSTQTEYSGDEGGVTVNRIFDWSGRNSGRDLRVEEQWNAYIADLRFQDLCETHGMEYVRTESRSDAIAKMLQPATLTIMPVPLLKSGNALANSINETVREGANIARTPVGRSGNVMTSVAKSSPTIIDGTKFTAHALEQMQARGIISPSAVLDVIRHPAQVLPGRTLGTMVYIRDNLKIVTNTAGDIVTVIWH